jgi:hypothetical protein
MDAVTLRIHANLINEMHGALGSGPVSLWFRRPPYSLRWPKPSRRVQFKVPEAEPAQMVRELKGGRFDLRRQPASRAESDP